MAAEAGNFLVVGVGASAGGLEALERMFAAVPPEVGMAFVVIQHLSPDFESRMDELLRRQTALPIFSVSDGMEVEPNAIYLIPPRKDMIIASGKLLLSDRGEERSFTLPIDQFFRSLAHDQGRRAVAVVLSGAGSDGSRGLREVHEAGGLVICQTPDSARFQGMPLAARETGAVDLFLKPEDVAPALVRYGDDPLRVAAALGGEPSEVVPGSAVDEVLRSLRNEYGIDFAYYKPSTVLRRIDRRLSLSNTTDMASYAERVRSDADELNALYRDLLIGVTRFFRDLEAFDKLDQEVLPRILQRVPPDEEIRVWVAGCATGEEAYSLAILLHEHFEAAKRPLNARIFATDVHRVSLDVASTGVYDEEALTDVSPARRQRYFSRYGNGHRVAKELRQLIVFARHNVITDAPFTRLHLVACRNLLIYLQPLVQKKVLSLFHFALKTGGTLFLGPSETPGELAEEFDALDPHWKVYSKQRDGRVGDTRISFPILPASRNRAAPANGGRPWPGPQMLSVYDRLLDRAMGPSLLVDERYQVVHSFGGAEALLRVRGGRLSMNVLDLVDERLKAPLLGALQHAHNQGVAARFQGVPVATNDGQARCSLAVEPLGDSGNPPTHFLVRLERSERAPVISEEMHAADVSAEPTDYATALETELRFTRESLQATIEELETANQELQATNQELVAANEELLSANEEQHSANEELYTVSVEHQQKITQLSELTDDLDNLLHSLEVGVLFLDENLGIRKFTAYMSRAFKLLPEDVGRPFDNFTHSIEHRGLEADVRQVAASRTPIEREVTGKDGVIYLLRVLPYRGASGQGGVVLTLIDASTLKRSEANVRRLSAIVESSTDAILAKDLSGKIVAWNKGAERLYGYALDEAVGRHVAFLVPDDKRDEDALMLERARRGEMIEPFETVRRRRDGTCVDVSLSVSAVLDEHNRVIGVSTIARDITQRKRDEAEVRRALRTRDQFMAMLSHELRNPLAALLHAGAILHRTEDREKRKRAVDAVSRQCKHMARLLDDLLDVSRMRQDGIELRKQPIDLRGTIESAVERIRPRADAAGVKIEVELPEEDVTVVADPDRMQQVEANLLCNAVKYTRGGGGVKLTLSSEAGRAILRVKDDGIGIPHNMVERIFEPFVRAVEDDPNGRVHGRASDGMGLGLALVRSIVQAHGGEVWAESEGPDRGSLFVASLPLAGELDIPTGDVEPERRARSILLVEDQEDSRELLKEILSGAGYQVTTAGDGKRAVALAVESRPSIAIVDIGLPEMSGYEVAAEIRRLFNDEAMFLVALTGYGQQQDRDAVLRAGFDQHLVKPVDADTLLEVLRSRRRLRRVRNLAEGLHS